VDLQISGYLSNRLVAAGYQVNRLDLEFTGVRPSLRNHVSPPDVVVAAFRTVHNFGGRSLSIRQLEKLIYESDYYIFIISKYTSKRKFFNEEISLGYRAQLNSKYQKFIPVCIDSTNLSSTYHELPPAINFANNHAQALKYLYDIISFKQSKLLTTFDIGDLTSNYSIISISRDINARLIEYFRKNPRELKTMDPFLFEEFIAQLFSSFGYSVELTKKTRDGGKDIIAIRKKEIDQKYIIECKCPQKSNIVGVRPVRELYGVKQSEGATKAILATTAYFSRDARLFFENNKWEIEGRDYDGILRWLNIDLLL